MKNTKNTKKAVTKQSKRINTSFKLLLFFSLFSLYLVLGLTVHASAKTEKKATTASTDPVINVTEDRMYNNSSYSTLFQVVDYEEDLYDNGSRQWTEYRICLETCTGQHFHYVTTDGDFSVGDFFTAVMDDNGTPEIKDDIIISLKYERPDLFTWDTF